MNSTRVTFRGSREGLRMTLGEGTWREVLNDLSLWLSRPTAQSFFRGARVLLETGDRRLGSNELEELLALFAQHQMELVSVVGEARTQQAFKDLRAAILKPPEALKSEKIAEASHAAPAQEDANALFLRRTIRSGQVIHHKGHIVIFGDVNPGAEVIADGDIIVWGKLRGVVHAGAAGNASAMVAALSLAPTQLRIGPQIALAPDDRRSRASQAEIARVREKKIVVDPWNI